jgi:hypothetical protein
MVPSKLTSEPIFGFGRSTRDEQEKVFQSKQLVKNQFLGSLPLMEGRPAPPPSTR